MQEPEKMKSDSIKPDLKHDSMEYSAATDGDDPLDIDHESEEEVESESITAEELELLGEDSQQDQAAALNTAELDSQADEDNFINEPEQPDELDGIVSTEEEENERQ